jgi:outer membrane protein OmpA-like peptidoglycan-associated protein
MRRELGLIGGGSAAVLLLVIGSQTGVIDRLGGDPAVSEAASDAGSDPDPAGTAEPASAPAADAPDPPDGETAAAAPPAPEPAATLGDASEIGPERERLAALQAEIDDLQAELAAREAALAGVADATAARDAEIERLTEELAMRDAELAEVRDELAGLEQQVAFDVRLDAMKRAASSGGSSEGELVEVAVETAAADPVVLAAEAAAAPERELTEVHFETGSATLTPGGRSRAAVAAVILADMDLSGIRLLGFTDRVGNPERNRELAAARAGVVAEFLVAAGLPADLIEATPMGETDLPIATGDGVSEPLNRCVSIVAVARTSG